MTDREEIQSAAVEIEPKPMIVSPVVLAPLPVWHEWISPTGARWIMPPSPIIWPTGPTR